MKIRNTKLSKRTLALLAATALLFGSGSYAGTKAALTYFSEDYRAAFELDHLQVHLLENGRDVCKVDGNRQNSWGTVHRSDDATAKARQEKYRGNLVQYLGYTFDPANALHRTDITAYKAVAQKIAEPGKVDPGRKYKEEIAAENGSNINEYVRLTVRKYWVDSKGNKNTSMDPELIKLTYGSKAYNSGAWQRNDAEHTAESDTFYLTNMLKGNATSPLLFDTLQIDTKVYQLGNKQTTTTRKAPENPGEGEVQVITYKYDYDDFTFYIEADVQAIQTHNVNDAIGSLWGVNNVSAANGTVTVK